MTSVPAPHATRWTILLFLQCLLLSTLHAEPSFPALSGRIVDQAGLLTSAEAAALTTQLEEHEQATSNQVVVVTVKSLQGYAISDFANLLGRHWQIGQAEQNNGVLLLVAPEDRKVRIEVGYGLEGALTDAISSDIIRRKILPAFREDDYSGGIRTGTNSILQAIAGEYTVDPRAANRAARGDRQQPLQGYFPLLFIGMIALSEILKRFGWSQLGNTAFPSAMIGIGVSAVTQNLWLGLAASAALFVLLFFFIKPQNGGTGTGHHHRSDHDGRSGRGGVGGRGGFSGGGGSFGGGGASGGW